MQRWALDLREPGLNSRETCCVVPCRHHMNEFRRWDSSKGESHSNLDSEDACASSERRSIPVLQFASFGSA
jgi:hypothetical protein